MLYEWAVIMSKKAQLPPHVACSYNLNLEYFKPVNQDVKRIVDYFTRNFSTISRVGFRSNLNLADMDGHSENMVKCTHYCGVVEGIVF